MKKILSKFDDIVMKICMFAMGLMAVMVMTSVILRYLFGISYIWASEFITYLFIFTTLIGTSIAVQKRECIKISFFRKRMPNKIQSFIFVSTQIIIIIVQIQVFRSSLRWIDKVGSTASIGLNISCKYVYMMLPVSAILIAFSNVRNLIKIFSRKK